MYKRTCHFIGAASGWGAKIRTCEEGPKVLLNHLENQHITWDMVHPKIRFIDQNIPLKDSLPLITEFNTQLSDKVFEVLKQGHFPVVIGGDHSIAVGTWNGVGCFLKKPLGLIWIDAHMDSHTTETTPSGAWHGMPLAGLLGYGIKELAQLKRKDPILKPENICMIGIRSFEEGEQKLLEKLGVKIYFIDEVKSLGFSNVLKSAIDHVTKNTDSYGVSLDIDVVDPQEAPGTGSIEPNGLKAEVLLNGLTLLRQDPRFIAFELVEFNPSLDIEDKTLKLCEQILSTIYRKQFKDRSRVA